ncbi:MAG: aminotransferase class I/II-fold pyridoxal phosphate-dependent enzyme [Planctomycetota bacterium]|nr:aminotransferase class I/II-fold pyridoxal phosphate-dependent enzyme [Planctomycetota bacterium]
MSLPPENPAPPQDQALSGRRLVSRRADGVESSGIRKIFERVQFMDDPINLSIGQAHFDVPEAVKEAAIAAIRDGFNRYTVTEGVPELNERILGRLADRYGYQGQQSLVTSGVSGGLLLGFMAALDKGDHVLLPDPYFTMYPVLAGLVDADWSGYEMYPGIPLTEAALEAALDPEGRSRLLLINSPSNPTGRVLSAEELDIVGAFARKHDLLVVSDEIYDEFVYDGPHVAAVGHVDEDRLLLLGGFSKTYGMPGWRMGYAVGPDDIIDAMRRIQQFTFVCAPSMVQLAGLAAMDVDMSAEIENYAQKRDSFYARLAGHYEFPKPGGSFYMFPELPKGATTEAFMERALERKLLIVPGKAFSARDTHFRLSFAASGEVLDRGVDALLALAEEFAEG